MQIISQEQMQKRFQALPEILQDILFSERTANIIGKTSALREVEEQTTLIAKLVGRVLLGYLRMENFVQEIQNEANISEKQAQEIAHDIDVEIFSNVRLELKKLYPPTIKTPNVVAHGFTPPTTKVQKRQVQKTGAFAFAQKFSGGMEKTEKNTEVKKHTNNIPITTKTKNDIPKPPHTSEKNPIPKNIQAEINAVNVEERVQQIKEASQDADTVEKARLRHFPTTKKQEDIKIKPVIQLPTFIQSKFTGSPRIPFTNINTKKGVDKEIKKEAFQKFTTKSTNTTGPKKEQQSPYREQIPAQKKQGEIIDLSKF